MLPRMVKRMLVCVVVVAGLAGCSSTAVKATAPNASVKAVPSTAATELDIATSWGQKLAAADAASPAGACTDPGAQSCADAQESIVAVVQQLSNVITSQNAQAAYPKTMAAISKVEASATDYLTRNCNGSATAKADGSPCFADSADVMVGVGMVQSALTLDEMTAKLAKGGK